MEVDSLLVRWKVFETHWSRYPCYEPVFRFGDFRGPTVIHIDCGTAFDIFPIVRSVVGAGTRNKTDIVAHDPSVPWGQ
jgi:hypothetical protein